MNPELAPSLGVIMASAATWLIIMEIENSNTASGR